MKTTTKETTSRQRFRSRIEYIQLHMELCDAGLRLISSQAHKAKAKPISISQSLGLDCSRYICLKHPTTEASRITNHSRSKNSELAIIDIFESFSEYLLGILEEMFAVKPMLVIGKSNSPLTFSFQEITSFRDWETLCREMIRLVYRSLESERSTQKLFDKIISKTGVVIDAKLRTECLGFLEMRHLIIHNKGLADELYKKQYGKLFPPKYDDSLTTDFKTVQRGAALVHDLIDAIDSQLLILGLAFARH